MINLEVKDELSKNLEHCILHFMSLTIGFTQQKMGHKYRIDSCYHIKRSTLYYYVRGWLILISARDVYMIKSSNRGTKLLTIVP